MNRSIVLLCGALLLASCGSRDPEWRVALHEDDAITISSLALNRSKTRGCGEIIVTRQNPRTYEISIECFNGKKRKNHRITYFPSLKVDGIQADSDPWERMSLSTVYCVKRPDGEWDLAFMDDDDARKRAVEISKETDQEVRFYSSDSLYFWITRKTDGAWRMIPAAYDEVEDRDDRRGCELETVKLRYQTGR